MQVELKANDKSVQAEISEEQLKKMGLFEQLKELGLVEDKPKTGYERVEDGEIYYITDFTRSSIKKKATGSSWDQKEYDSGNYFSNEMVAENNVRADKLFCCLRQWQGMHDRAITKKDWKNDKINKHFITYNYRFNIFEIGRSTQRREPNVIYFTTKEKATEAIKKFRNELEWYFKWYQQRLDEE